MVLFSAIDAAMAFPPSEPRLFADTSSCLPRVTRESKKRRRGKKYMFVKDKEERGSLES